MSKLVTNLNPIMSNSRKHPSHTKDDFWTSEGKGGFFELEFLRHESTCDWNSKGIEGFQSWDFQRVQTSDFMDFSFPIRVQKVIS